MLHQILHAALAAIVGAGTPIESPAIEPESSPTSQDPAPPEEPKWTGAVALGLARAMGNTERTSGNLTADAALRRAKDRWTFGAWWFYAEEENDLGESTLTERRYGGKGQYDYFLSEKSYVLANALGERDDKARLQLRATAGLGYGHQFKEEENFKLSGELGVVYFIEDYRTPEPTTDVPNPEVVGPETYPAARAAYKVEYKPGASWTLSQIGEAYPSLEDGEDFYSKLDSRVRYDMSANLFGQFQWLWDYDNTPASGQERSDYRLFLTVGYSF